MAIKFLFYCIKSHNSQSDSAMSKTETVEEFFVTLLFDKTPRSENKQINQCT